MIFFISLFTGYVTLIDFRILNLWNKLQGLLYMISNILVKSALPFGQGLLERMASMY